MNNKLIIAVLLFTTLVSANDAQDKEYLKQKFDSLIQEKADEMQQAEYEYSLWTKGLNKYLSEHSNPNIQAIGVQYLIKVSESLPEEYSDRVMNNQESIETMIDKLVRDKEISPQALIILESICQSKKFTGKCDEQLLSQARIDREPDNINSYLNPLDRAIKEKDKATINEVLEKMTQAKYDNNHYYVIPELEQAIREYEQQNPFPQSYIETNKAMYDELIGVSDSKLQDMFDNMQEYMLFGLFIGYKLAMPMPNYLSIKNQCSSDETVSDKCMKISQTLQSKSHSLLGTVLGNAIQLDLLKNSVDQQAYLKLKQQDENFKNGYMCLSQSLFNNENSLDNSFNLEYYQIANKLEREKGELASLMKQAELNYQYQLSKGNTQAVNPEVCFETSIK